VAWYGVYIDNIDAHKALLEGEINGEVRINLFIGGLGFLG